MAKRIIILLLIGCCFTEISGQIVKDNAIFHKLTTRTGLPNNAISEIVQDSLGFIWFATKNGLTRFDGYDCKVYSNIEGDSTSLIQNRIQSLKVDQQGNIWIGTDIGLCKYITEKDMFFNVPLKETNDVWSVQVDKNNRVWVNYGQDGIAVFEAGNSEIIEFISPSRYLIESYSNLDLTFILRDVDGAMWYRGNGAFVRFWFENNQCKIQRFEGDFGGVVQQVPRPQVLIQSKSKDYYLANNGLYVLKLNDLSEPIFHPIDIFPNMTPAYYDDFDIFSMIEDIQGNIWIATKNYGIKKYSPSTGTVKEIEFNELEDNQIVRDIRLDKDGNLLFFIERTGFVLFDIKSNKYEFYFHDAKNSNSISEKLFVLGAVGRHFFQDRSGTYWFITGEGVNFLYKDKLKFNHVSELSGPKNSIMPGQVWGIFEDEQGWLWTGVLNSGIHVVEPDGIEVHHYYEKINYEFGSARTFLQISENEFWFGSQRIERFLYDYRRKELTKIGHYQHDYGDTNSLSSWRIYYMFKDKSGAIWVGTSDGLNLFTGSGKEIKSGEFKRFKTQKDDPNSIAGNIVFHIMEDHKSRLWISTNEGVSILDENRKQFKTLPIDSETPVYNIRQIEEGKPGIFWIATEGNGIFSYNENSESITRYTDNDGLPSNNILGLYSVKNDIWMSSDRGLAVLYDSTKHIKRFDLFDGMQDEVFTIGAHHRGKQTGRIYFGGIGGINYFLPDSIESSTYSPRIALTSFKIFHEEVKANSRYNGRIILEKSVNYTDEIVLSHKEKNFSIEYAALDYASPENIRYRYKLEGLNNDWIYTESKDRTISYLGVRPDKYNLVIESTNADGIWVENTFEMSVVVLPPWWQTWWFRGLMVIMVLVLIVLVSYIRVRSLRYRQKELEDTVEKRTAEVVKQREELRQQSENLKEVNVLLEEKQEEIAAQAEELSFSNEQLMKLNATKDKFFSIIGHDLKNPFQGIIGFSDILIDKLSKINDKELIDFVSIIKETSTGAFNLLENLLHWSRSQTENIKYEPEHFDLNEIVIKSIKVLQLTADSKGIILENKMKENTYCFADKNMMSTVVRNIINNAVKFTPVGGKITVSSKLIDDYIIIDIKDTGVGMSQSVLDKLFRIDQQVSTKGTGGEAGTGLGLLICYEFVKRNKGQIIVKSKKEEGSMFSIRLPYQEGSKIEVKDIVQKEEAIQPQQESVSVELTEDEKTVLKDKKIIVVEDNDNIRQTIVISLNEMCQVGEAENGLKGWEKIIEVMPDIIISDVMMPEMDGFELSKKVRFEALTSHIPLVLLTAKMSNASQVEGLETGAVDYITKPFNKDVLRLKVKNILISRDKLKTKYQQSPFIDESMISVTSRDEEFLNTVVGFLEEHIKDPNINVSGLSEKIGMTRGHFYKKMQALTGLPPNEFIRTYRLKKAAQLLKSERYQAKEIAFMVGLSNTNYFYTQFKKQFGMSTKDFLDQEKRKK